MNEAVNLSGEQARCLALRLATRQLATDWLEWEDVPMLDEASFERLVKAADHVVHNLLVKSRVLDRELEVDSAELLERVE